MSAPSVFSADTLCDVCEEHAADVYCPECEMPLCTANGCDADMHASAKMSAHQRQYQPKAIASDEPAAEVAAETGNAQEQLADESVPVDNVPAGDMASTAEQQDAAKPTIMVDESQPVDVAPAAFAGAAAVTTPSALPSTTEQIVNKPAAVEAEKSLPSTSRQTLPDETVKAPQASHSAPTAIPPLQTSALQHPHLSSNESNTHEPFTFRSNASMLSSASTASHASSLNDIVSDDLQSARQSLSRSSLSDSKQWVKTTDTKTGKYIYYNTVTRETSKRNPLRAYQSAPAQPPTHRSYISESGYMADTSAPSVSVRSVVQSLKRGGNRPSYDPHQSPYMQNRQPPHTDKQRLHAIYTRQSSMASQQSHYTTSAAQRQARPFSAAGMSVNMSRSIGSTSFDGSHSRSLSAVPTEYSYQENVSTSHTEYETNTNLPTDRSSIQFYNTESDTPEAFSAQQSARSTHDSATVYTDENSESFADPAFNVPTTLHRSTHSTGAQLSKARLSSAPAVRPKPVWSYPVKADGTFQFHLHSADQQHITTASRLRPKSSNALKTHAHRANEMLRSRLASMAVVAADVIKHLAALNTTYSLVSTEVSKLQHSIDRTHRALHIVSQRNAYRHTAIQHPLISSALQVTAGDAELEQALYHEFHSYHTLIEQLQQQLDVGESHISSLHQLQATLTQQHGELQAIITADQLCLDRSENRAVSRAAMHAMHAATNRQPFDPQQLAETVNQLALARQNAMQYVQTNNALLDKINVQLRDLRRRSGFAARTCVQHAAEQRAAMSTLIHTNASRLPGLLKHEKELQHRVACTVKPLQLCEERYAMRLEAANSMPIDRRTGNVMDPVREELEAELQDLHHTLAQLQLDTQTVAHEIRVCQDVSEDFNSSMQAANTIYDFYTSIVSLDPSENEYSGTTSTLLGQSNGVRAKSARINPTLLAALSYQSEADRKADVELQRLRSQNMRKEIALLDRLKVQSQRKLMAQQPRSALESAMAALNADSERLRNELAVK